MQIVTKPIKGGILVTLESEALSVSFPVAHQDEQAVIDTIREGFAEARASEQGEE